MDKFSKRMDMLELFLRFLLLGLAVANLVLMLAHRREDERL